MKPPTMPVTIPTTAPRNSRWRLAAMWRISSPSRTRAHITSTTSVTGGSVARLGWKTAQPTIHASSTSTNGSAGSARHAIAPGPKRTRSCSMATCTVIVARLRRVGKGAEHESRPSAATGAAPCPRGIRVVDAVRVGTAHAYRIARMRRAVCVRAPLPTLHMRYTSSPQHPPARHGDVLDRLHDQAVDHDVEAADHDHADDDAVDLPEGAGAEDEVAEPALAHQHLGGDQRAPAVAHAEPQADHDRRQRARQVDIGDDAQLARPERAQRERIALRDRAHADHGIEDDRHDQRIDHDDQRRRVAEAEPDDRERQPGDAGNALRE